MPVISLDFEFTKSETNLWLTGAGVGVVDVGIIDPAGRTDTVRPLVARKSDDVWYVEYTPLVEGLHSVNIFFAGKPIPNSPYPVAVARGTCISLLHII